MRRILTKCQAIHRELTEIKSRIESDIEREKRIGTDASLTTIARLTGLLGYMSTSLTQFKDGKMAKSYRERTCDIEANLYQLIENNVKLEQSNDPKAYSKVSFEMKTTLNPRCNLT